MINYRTNYKDTLGINIEKNVISILVYPSEMRGKDILIYLSSSHKNEILKKYYKATDAIRYVVDGIPNGFYSFNIFILDTISNMYIGYYSDKQIIIEVESNMIRFVQSAVFMDNSLTMNSLFDQSYLSKPCNALDIQISNLALNITNSINEDYDKIRAIHDWVAENLFYDRDSLNYDFYIYRKHDPSKTLSTLKGVCQGYANLTDALLSSLGFRSIIIPCYALGQSTTGDWNMPSYTGRNANHVMNAVYIYDRWILMDVTWDSHNVYEHGKRSKKKSMTVTHQYFDPTLFFLSSTHRFIK